MKKLYLLAIALLCATQSVSAAGRGILDRAALYPSKNPITSSGTQKILPGVIEVWIFKRHTDLSPKKPVYIVHFGGNASRAEWGGPDFLDDFPSQVEPIAWVVNYPGYGGSAGEAKLSEFPRTALQVYEAIQEEAKGAPIWVSSFSIGTLPALYLAQAKKVDAMVLKNPIPLNEFIELKFS